MAEYRNETASAQVIGGQVLAPKQYVELPDDTIGLDRMVKRGVVSKKGAPAASSGDSQQSGGSATEDALRNMMLDEIEYLTGTRPGARSKIETLQKSLQDARANQLEDRAKAEEQTKADAEADEKAAKDGGKNEGKE